MIIARHIGFVANQQRRLLDDVSFTIHPGELTVLMGPNGAGKSTLLRILSGERKPHEGEVLWRGRSIHCIPPRELALERAVLTQHFALGLPFTVEEVVQMGRYPHASSGTTAEDRRIVGDCLRDVQAGHLAGRLFNTLSGGEQQRVQLARVLAQLEGADRSDEGTMRGWGDGSRGDAKADGDEGAIFDGNERLVGNEGTKRGGVDRNSGDGEVRRDGVERFPAKLLLLDEPTSNMDWLHQQLTLTKAKEMALRGYTVVVVLHDLNLAAQYADRMLLLKQGRLLAMGRPEEILEPALIGEAYGLRVHVIRPGECAFPVIVPEAIKIEGIKMEGMGAYEWSYPGLMAANADTKL